MVLEQTRVAIKHSMLIYTIAGKYITTC